MPKKMTKLPKIAAIKLHTTRSEVHFANFVPHGLPRIWTHLTVNVRHFSRDYSLPLILTTMFLFLIIIAMFLRVSQRESLADLLAGVTTPGQDYGTLLSKDKTTNLKKNTDTSEPTAQAPAGSPNSFAIRSTQTNPITPPSGGGTTPTPPPFGVSIAYFRQDSETLECDTPKPKIQTCSKRYVFGAGIRTQNGPGTVNYGWRSNLASVIEDSSISVGSGEILTPVQKVIILDCTNPSSVSLQLAITTPVVTQSAVLNINHNCIGI